ncbi:MAG: hypothetical protein EP329_06930 [Deltaproteobacteria bacterium]|nr:MAG: hypothetical protein EP329_06930 [Deltaproteobacteria bacterium]
MPSTPRRRPGLAPLAAVAVAALVALPAAPAAAQPGGLTVDASTPWSLSGWPVPVQVLVHSPRAVTLSVDVTCGTVSAQASFPVPAGTRLRRTVLVPATDLNSFGCAPRVKWRSDDGDEGVASGTIAQNSLDVAVVTPHGELWVDEDWRLADVTAQSLPDRWQGYPLDATFVIGSQADAALSDAQRSALATWSRAGGRLLLLDLGEGLARWEALGAVPTVAVSGYQEPLQEWLKKPQDAEASPWMHRVPGTETVPVGGFILVALLFAILVGPVNLWWCIKKKNQRGLFLLTTPLLSLAASGVLIGYNVVSEGLGVKRAAIQLSWLDGAHHSALTFTGVTYFAGTGVGDFDIGPDVLVRLLHAAEMAPESYSPVEDLPTPRQTRWTDVAQRLTGEWIPTRKNRQLTFVSPEADRRRLTLQQRGGAYELVNGLDVAATGVWWVAPGGAVWFCQDVEPGRSCVMTESPGGLPGGVPFGRLGPGAERVWKRADAPNHFVAELARPLAPVPGPDASDEAPLQAWVAGPLSAATPVPAEVTP